MSPVKVQDSKTKLRPEYRVVTLKMTIASLYCNLIVYTLDRGEVGYRIWCEAASSNLRPPIAHWLEIGIQNRIWEFDCLFVSTSVAWKNVSNQIMNPFPVTLS
jgi:hypothetical protein